MVFDTHTHAYFSDLRNREDEILANMSASGVDFAVQIGCDAPTSEEAVALAGRHPDRYRATVGLHPTEAQDLDSDRLDAEIAKLREVALSHRGTVVGVGETGWDFFHLSKDPAVATVQKSRQKSAFEAQIGLAAELELPLIIHTRDSSDAVLKTFAAHPVSRAVIHCYSENPDFARRMMEICPGVMFGFSGILTYKSAKNVQETAAMLPLDRILVETDAPFLAPDPVRGTVNESANVRHVLEKLKTLRGESGDEVERTIWENSVRFYGIK
jgi:TatD DNase family protein